MGRIIGSLIQGLLLGGIAVAVFWMLVTHNNSPKVITPPAMVVGYQIPEPGTWKPIKVSGTVGPADPLIIPANLEGRVSRIVVKPGQILAKGASVIYLDDVKARLRFQQFQAQIAMEQADAQSQLFDEEDETPPSIFNDEAEKPKPERQAPGVIPRALVDRGKPESKSAIEESPDKEEKPPVHHEPDSQERLKAMRSNLDSYVIRMPEAGRVSRILVSPGSKVFADTPLLQVASRNPLQVEANLSRSYLQWLGKNQPVEIRNNKIHAVAEGKISKIEIPEENQEPIGILKIAFTKAEPGVFRTGTTVDVIVKLPMTNSIWVPMKAVKFRGDVPIVYIIERNGITGRVVERPVVLGDADSGQVVIASGVSPGETIVIEHATALRHNQEVSDVKYRK